MLDNFHLKITAMNYYSSLNTLLSCMYNLYQNDPNTMSIFNNDIIFQFQQFYTDGARIEAAFRKYFHRAEPEQTNDSYEIMVCHANVIRYFVCRLVISEPYTC